MDPELTVAATTFPSCTCLSAATLGTGADVSGLEIVITGGRTPGGVVSNGLTGCCWRRIGGGGDVTDEGVVDAITVEGTEDDGGITGVNVTTDGVVTTGGGGGAEAAETVTCGDGEGIELGARTGGDCWGDDVMLTSEILDGGGGVMLWGWGPSCRGETLNEVAPSFGNTVVFVVVLTITGVDVVTATKEGAEEGVVGVTTGGGAGDDNMGIGGVFCCCTGTWATVTGVFGCEAAWVVGVITDGLETAGIMVTSDFAGAATTGGGGGTRDVLSLGVTMGGETVTLATTVPFVLEEEDSIGDSIVETGGGLLLVSFEGEAFSDIFSIVTMGTGDFS